MFALAALSLLALSPHGDARSFGSWTVSCNDRLRCVAMETQLPAERGSLSRASMRITRDGGAGKTVVEIWPDHPVTTPVTITTGNTVVYRGKINGDVVRLIGRDAERAAKAASGTADHAFVIRTHDGGYLGKVELGGLGDAMRYMDEVQSRPSMG